MAITLLERLRQVECNREPFTPEHAKCVCRLTNEAAAEIEQYERDEASQLAAIKLLRDKLALILPLAKGYAAEHPVGSNGAYVSVAERAMDSTENFTEEVADTDRRFRQR